MKNIGIIETERDKNYDNDTNSILCKYNRDYAPCPKNAVNFLAA
jgi:hypothetical protein